MVNSNHGRILHGFGAKVTQWSKITYAPMPCNVFARSDPRKYVDEPYIAKNKTHYHCQSSAVTLRQSLQTLLPVTMLLCLRSVTATFGHVFLIYLLTYQIHE